MPRGRSAALVSAVVLNRDAWSDGVDQRRRTGLLVAVVGGEVEIDRADEIGRARKPVLDVPCEISEVEHPECAVGDHDADRTSVFGWINRLRFVFRAQRILLPRTRQSGLDRLAGGCDDG